MSLRWNSYEVIDMQMKIYGVPEDSSLYWVSRSYRYQFVEDKT